MTQASVLVTDDESGIRLMLRTALESEGYSVTEAADGRQAIDAVQQHAPDLMVLDLNMPGLDGMAVLEEMTRLAAKSRPRIIVLTAYGSIPAAVKATRLGALDFLEKPVTPAELREAVRSVLEEPQLDAPPPAEAVGGYERVLQRIRRALRMADLTSAEALLGKAAESREKHSAEYFNLLGVLYEAQHKWRLARKCYGKAIAADSKCESAQANMRRLYELNTFGHSAQDVVLGDEPHDMWFARMPEAHN